MNIARRGSHQTESIVMRVTPEDKAAIRLAADHSGQTMSDLIKGILIEQKVIKAIYRAW